MIGSVADCPLASVTVTPALGVRRNRWKVDGRFTAVLIVRSRPARIWTELVPPPLSIVPLTPVTSTGVPT